jgi:hypothetical protein
LDVARTQPVRLRARRYVLHVAKHSQITLVAELTRMDEFLECLSMKLNPIPLLLLTTLTLCAQSDLKLTIHLDANQKPVLRLSGRPGVTNEIQFTDALSASNTWQQLTNFVPGASEEQVLDPTPPTQGSRYYRAIAQAAPARPTMESALDGAEFVWTTGSGAPWLPQTSVTFDGVDAAQSGTPPPGGQSWLHATVNGPGTVQFQWAFAASPADTLRFYTYLGGVPTDLYLAELSGSQANWHSFTLDLPGGTHVLRWEYNRASGSVGGTGWVDQVQVILPCPTNGLYDDFTANEINGYRWLTNQPNLPQLASQRLVFAVNSGSKQLSARCAGCSEVAADVALTGFSGNSWFNLCNRWFQVNGTNCIAIIGVQTDSTTNLFSPSLTAQVLAEDTGAIFWRREVPLGNNPNSVRLKMGYDAVRMRVEFWSNDLSFALCPLPSHTTTTPNYGRWWMDAGASGGAQASYMVDNVSVQQAYSAVNPDYDHVYVNRNATPPFWGTSAHPLPGIQIGIARSHNGSTVHIAPGTYLEQVELDHRRQWQHLNFLTLQGTGAAVLSGQGAYCGLFVSGHPWITVSNLTITGYTNGLIVSDDTEHVILQRCAITNNVGAGVMVSAETTLIEDCVVSSNGGRGLDLGGGSSNTTVRIDRCRVQNNGDHGVFAAEGAHIINSFVTANRNGGIVLWSDGMVEASTIADNDGPGVFLNTPATAPAVQVIGNIVTGNGGTGIDATFVGGELWVRNNDLWFNTGSNHTGVTNKVPDLSFWGNFSVNPEFVDGGDYHLSANSPCINANPNSFPSGSSDLDGEPRVQFDSADTGADEAAYAEARYTFATLAGCGSLFADGAGSAARFNAPSGAAVDNGGNVYVADTFNHTIRKISPTGTVTTLAGIPGISGSADGTGSAARFNLPYGVAADNTGNVYVADTYNHTIRKVSAVGVVTTFAGTARQSGSTDGTGSAARFKEPSGVAVDDVGNVYVADASNYTIRKISPAGSVTTLAGMAGSSGRADGTGSAARFYFPFGVAVDHAGNAYVADMVNHTIRIVTPAGEVTTLAGSPGYSGDADGMGSAARFDHPRGVAVDDAGNVFVSDASNYTIRKISPAGSVSTLAGIPGVSGSADGTNSAARFYFPFGVTVDDAGGVYVADTSNHTIRKVTPAGVVGTLAGSPDGSGSTDGAGSAARFNQPRGVAVHGTGEIYVADTYNHTIRKLTPAGVVATLAGGPGNSGSANGTGSAARFWHPSGVAVDNVNVVYVADTSNHTIRKVSAAGLVTTLAGLARSPGSIDGTGSAARFLFPSGVAVDGALSVYVADTGNHTIRKISAAGNVTTLAGLPGISGSADGTGATARFNNLNGVAVDDIGNVYVADTSNHTIRKVTPAGVVTTLAGSAGNPGSADGTGNAARFFFPSGVAVGGTDHVYVADQDNHTIREVTPMGVVRTVAGSPDGPGSSDGTGSAARFWSPNGVAADGLGNIYVSDNFNNSIRMGFRGYPLLPAP